MYKHVVQFTSYVSRITCNSNFVLRGISHMVDIYQPRGLRLSTTWPTIVSQKRGRGIFRKYAIEK